MPRESAAGEYSVTRNELANMRGGSPERFVPGMMRGQLIEAEHLTRYHWASQFGARRRVLDAGCGVGYGSVLLAEAGADQVVGVDSAASVIEAVVPQMPETVQLEVGDLRSLRFPDNAFDLVVCLEVIEHIEEQAAVLDELVRVLAPGGVLLVSSPDRDATGGDNPHHLHELTSAELTAALSQRLDRVRLLGQNAYFSSVIMPEPGSDATGVLDAPTVVWAVEVQAKLSSYVIAVASDGPFDEPRPFVGVTSGLDYSTWQGAFDGAVARIQLQARRIDELEQQLRDRAEIHQRLIEAEQRLVALPELEGGIIELRATLDEVRESNDHDSELLKQRIARADRVLRDVQSSPSWRITRPLRAIKGLLRS